MSVRDTIDDHEERICTLERIVSELIRNKQERVEEIEETIKIDEKKKSRLVMDNSGKLTRVPYE